jgi:hypothetical protein
MNGSWSRPGFCLLFTDSFYRVIVWEDPSLDYHARS